MPDQTKQTISVSRLKADCAGILRGAYQTRASVVITRYGKPIAEIAPIDSIASPDAWIGSMQGSVFLMGDVISPVSHPDEWEVHHS